ncbi:MAG: ABC transporter permease [Gemmatimonadota bacterium]|nr:MAG: ABC transporter permease [Gemmatimonadota bacterium]
MFSAMLYDLRVALRSMARRPLFHSILVLILGIGLGANAAMFRMVDSVVLEPLPYPDADRLVWMWSVTPQGNNNTVAALDYMDYRERNTTLEALAAYSTWPERFVTTGGDEPEVLVGAATSGNFFRTLGVEPVVGRGLMLEDEDPAAGNPVVLSHGLWQRRYGGDPEIVGRTIGLEGGAYDVVGVMPAGFAFPSWADLWRPMRMTEQQAQGRGNNNFRVLGRLARGATIERAQSELLAIAAGIAEEFPDAKQGWTISLLPLQDVFVGDARAMLWLLQGAVGLVLLIACGNVAALLLARAVGRHGELAVRLALGASRGRVARALLTESVVLALFGGALGLGVAYGALKVLASVGGASRAQLAGIEVDGTALLFTLIVALATGFLFGLAPALRAPQLQLVDALKEGRRGVRMTGGLHLQSGLVVGQVALSLILLVGAGLLMRSFLKLQQEDLGFQPQGIVTARLRLPSVVYGAERSPQAFYDAALERLRALPGVEAAAFIDALPVIGGFGPYNYVHPEGRPAATPADRLTGVRRVVSPGYFATMGIPLIRGRDFQSGDLADAPLVGVISRSMAEEFFPGEDPIGRSIVFPFSTPIYFEVVGVVGDVPLGPVEADPRNTMYFAQAQFGRPLSTFVVVRARGELLLSATALAATIREVDPSVPVSNVRPMTTLVSASMADDRFRTLLLGAFAAVALLLAALGLYGVLAQLVGRRTHELGVRIALGADRADILGWVLLHGMRLAGLGLLIGLAGAAATSRLARGMLFEIEPLDPVTFAGTAALLALVALTAALVPAWRATRVDPVDSLRAE